MKAPKRLYVDVRYLGDTRVVVGKLMTLADAQKFQAAQYEKGDGADYAIETEQQ